LGRGDVKKRRTFFGILSLGLAAAIGVGALVGYYSTNRSGFFAGLVVFMALAAYAVFRNPPKSRGRSGADRIDFGR